MSQKIAFVETVELVAGGLAKYEGIGSAEGTVRIRRWTTGTGGRIILDPKVEEVSIDDIKQIKATN